MEKNNKKEGKKVARVNQPMKKIKEMMEDILTTEEISDVIESRRKMKRDREMNKQEEDTQETDMSQILTMLPMFQKMKGMGINTDNIDPMWLMMLNANQSKGNSNLNQLFLMMAMMNMMSQAQPQQQINQNGKPVPIQGGVTPEMFQLLFNQLQEVMKQQETKPAIDPSLMAMLTVLNKNQQNPKTDESTRLVLQELRNTQQQNQTQQLNLIVQNMNDKFERALEGIAGALNRESPEAKLRSNWDLLRSIQGDQREKSTAELEYGLKQQELLMKQQERKDMLAMEQREKDREDAKSDRIMGLAGTAIEKLIGTNLGDLVNSIAKNTRKKDKHQNSGDEEFDPSLLDALG